MRSSEMTFPIDHGIHSNKRYEWWHYVGNLTSRVGLRLGYQVTFFRRKGFGGQAFVVHFAVTDLDNGKYFYSERKTRHAQIGDFSLCAKGCFVRILNHKHRVVAEGDGFSLDLSLLAAQGPVIHRKPGYYSVTDLDTSGEIRIGDAIFEVQGSSWMDHEFFSEPCDTGVTGWDWFGLRLPEVDLMIYRLRNKKGCLESSGATIVREGNVKHLDSCEVTVRGLARCVYPVMWHIAIPSERIDVIAKMCAPTTEFRSSVLDTNYHEGLVKVTPGGFGYVEMTGYDKPFRSLSRTKALWKLLSRR